MTYSAGFTTSPSPSPSPLGYDDSNNNTCSKLAGSKSKLNEELLLMTGGVEKKILEEGRPGNICVVVDPAINTERLCLREARVSDLDDLHAVWSNEDVMRYWYDNWLFFFLIKTAPIYTRIHIYNLSVFIIIIEDNRIN